VRLLCIDVMHATVFAGVGDTFGTCFGPLSRNRNFGMRLGKGETMAEILASR
jgi:glycerol-3-phosphate dehydrogenase